MRLFLLACFFCLRGLCGGLRLWPFLRAPQDLALHQHAQLLIAAEELLLQLPVFGELLTKVAVARFTRTLGTMVSSGVPILEALGILTQGTGSGREAGTILVPSPERRADKRSIRWEMRWISS